jgi:SAM-dependent methyltransferase
MVTRNQLRRAIASGGFLIEPYEGRYDMLCAAATDVYTRCNLTRWICISRIREFLLPHLPNKYVGKLGVPIEELDRQIEALADYALHDGWSGPLFEVESGLVHGQWSKNLYDVADESLIQSIPSTTRSLLSVGAGWGVTERELASRGMDVVAIPVDPIFGEALRRRGISTAEGPLSAALSAITPGRFDCVLLSDVLHLVPDPIAWLRMLRPMLRPGGTLVFSVPQTNDLPGRVKAFARRNSGREAVGVSRVNATSHRDVERWLERSGYGITHLATRLSPRRERAANASLGLLRNALAEQLIVRAAASSSGR